MSGMLGKLFAALPTSAPSSRAPNPLDSNLEDHFTYNLLFPDAEALCHHDQVFSLAAGTVLTPATTNACDVNGDIDLDTRDVRVIIMQEATPLSGSAYLLYDSYTPPTPTPTPSPSLDRQASSQEPALPPRAEGRRSISSPRKPSIGQASRPVVIQQENAPPRAFGAFDRRATHTRTFSYNETEGQRSAREYREEVTTFSNCIFGNSEVLAYKGAGTKVHVLPSESRPYPTSSSYAADGSLGRSSMRGSRLAQSFTSENVGPGPTSADFPNTTATTRGERKKVLITRMFPVPLPNDDTEDAHDHTPTPHNKAETGGYPFPKIGENGLAGAKKLSPKQKRTPMYAVGLVIHLPAAPHVASIAASRSSFRAPGSYTEQDSFPSSFNSARRAGWTMLGNGFGVESLDSSFSSEVDDRIDIITQHWDIIMRTLSHLQAVATCTILPMLKQADMNSPDPHNAPGHHRIPSASISISGKRVEDKPFKTPKTNAKMVQLMQNCLMQVERIRKEVTTSRQRIISGIKITQVVTGQGRWGIWREEARVMRNLAGGKDEGFFFFNLLTGFLGNHTEWLQALGPSWYRRRYHEQQRASREDGMAIPARTIIVSSDKIVARRLIFLLSAFLPANQQLPSSRFHRPSTSTSLGGYSQSPPTFAVPILREESLRKRINKRSNSSRAPHSRTSSFPTQIMQIAGLGITTHPTEIHHDRRPSDATSVKTANLPIPGSDIGTRKSSTATTSTVTPVTTMPHFSTRRPIRGTGPVPRPGSSGSLATDDLLRSLKRGNSSGQFNNDSNGSNSRWGSMISGFWSSRRRDSTSMTDVSPSSAEGVEINGPHHKGGYSHRNKLAEMADEGSRYPLKTGVQQERDLRKSESSTETARATEVQVEELAEQTVPSTDRTPDPSGAYRSPVKTSINTEDGVIDIDVPLPDYLSFETAVSSPSSSGYLSTPGFGNGMEAFEHPSRSGLDSETTLNVGGWLPQYHPDFALQAIPQQDDLVSQIKASMRSEPTPALTSTSAPDVHRTNRWIDISSALIADTTSYTIKRLRYSRLIKLHSLDQTTPSLSQSDSKYGNVYAAQTTPEIDMYEDIEERFTEEPILSMDEVLIDAVERILALSTQVSKSNSLCSSRSHSRSASRSASRKRDPLDTNESGRVKENAASDAQPKSCESRYEGWKEGKENNDAKEGERARARETEARLEVPRNECKKMILSALEEVVREVAESMLSGEGDRERERESFLREGVRAWLGNLEGS